MKKTFLILGALVCATACMSAQGGDIKLEKSNMERKTTLMQSLADRKSVREFSDAELSAADLSDLLWAANGYNRPEEKKRTAPTAMNKQEIDLYVFMKSGAYLYDAEGNTLKQIAEGDHRGLLAAGQDFVATAPAILVIVSDMSRFGEKNDRNLRMTSMDAGMVSQNISLFCASAGLNTVPRAMMEIEKIAATLKLSDNQIVQLNHPVGYPVKK